MNFSINLAVFVFIFPVGLTLYVKDSYTNENLISTDGYPLEVHHVTTEDGYVIELHRIPYGINETSFGSKKIFGKWKKVVFFAHNTFGNSESFVALGSKNGLAYMVANAGYDVWLLNVRGTKFSRRHVNISAESDEFWKFSWHEHAVFDMAPSIDYVLNFTGEDQLDYIGFSMGVTMFMVLMSERPEYNVKIRTMIALAPAVYITHSLGSVLDLSPTTWVLAKTFANLQKLNFPPLELQVSKVFSELCHPKKPVLYVQMCDELMRRLSGGRSNIDSRMLPYFFTLFPDQTSLRTVAHFGQLRNTDKFEKYNFGRTMNWRKYGSYNPPTYNLSEVSASVNLIYGDQDGLVGQKDVERLILELPNVATITRVPNYSHYDFIWAKSAPSKVYYIILEKLKNVESLGKLTSTIIL